MECFSGFGQTKLVIHSADPSTVAGNVAYGGVGFRPSSIVFVCRASAQASWGMSDSGLGSGVVTSYNNLPVYSVSGGQVIWHLYDSSNYTFGAIASYDADGFTLTWAKTGTVPSVTLYILALCFR